MGIVVGPPTDTGIAMGSPTYMYINNHRYTHMGITVGLNSYTSYAYRALNDIILIMVANMPD